MAVQLRIHGKLLPAPREAPLFRTAIEAGLFVPSSCGGQGKCRECLVEIEHGGEHLSPRTPEEAGLHADFRLACRARVISERGEVACHTLTRGRLRIVEASEGLDVGELELAPAVVRRGGAAVRSGERLEAAPERILGLAIDLGTTTIAMRLCDLETGEVAAVQTLENPQRFAGSDVMARIAFDTRHRRRLLQRTTLAYLARAIDALPLPAEEIFEVVVVGNTTMRDLFFGLDVRPIGADPYRSITEAELRAGKRTTTELRRRAASLGLPVHPAAHVIGLPLVASHLGADAAAAMLATGIGRGRELRALMDIGTNTELILGNDERLLAASCPAGPAFEGGGISCGMPGVEGAIEDVELAEAGVCALGVIGGGAPQGICGSGLVALLAELLRTGRMNALGRFEADEDEDGVVLDRERGLVFTEADVNELAQAKGANAAGLAVLLKRYGIPAERIERFHLAGGFGRHLEVGAARAIGLVPDLGDGRIVQVGNAALAGAQRALLSVREREFLEALVKRVEHVRLETDPGFFDAFVDGCQFRRFAG